MKKVSFEHFLTLLAEKRSRHGLPSMNLLPVTFLHDLSDNPKLTLDIIEELAQELNMRVTRNSLKSDFLSPYLRYNLQDLYDAFRRLDAELAFHRQRKYWYVLATVLCACTMYEFFVELAILQSILLATATSAIFQYLRGAS